jgi:hypothetical protein
VLATVADNQSAVVEALEALSNPMLGMAHALRSKEPAPPAEGEA